MTTAQDQQSRALSTLRHLYSQMVRGLVKDSAQAKRIAEGMLSPAIQKIEQAARALPAGMEPVGYLIDWPDEPELGHYFAEEANDSARSQALHTAAQVQAMGRVPPGWQITEDMHIAAVKVLHRASGVDGLPQRMVDAMLAAAPRPPIAQKRYRLLVRNVDTIQADDEFLRDADSNWQIDPQGIFVGMTYMSNVLLPARRAIVPAP